MENPEAHAQITQLSSRDISTHVKNAVLLISSHFEHYGSVSMARAQYICIGHGPRSRFCSVPRSEMKSTVQLRWKIIFPFLAKARSHTHTLYAHGHETLQGMGKWHFESTIERSFTVYCSLTTYQDPTKLPSVVVSLDWTGVKPPAYLDLQGT